MIQPSLCILATKTVLVSSLDAVEMLLSVEGSRLWHFIPLQIWIAHSLHWFLLTPVEAQGSRSGYEFDM